MGALSSRLVYTFGLKIAFMGSETNLFSGTDTFASVEILDSGGEPVIRRASPPNMRQTFKRNPVANVWPVNNPATLALDWPTMLHTRRSTQTAATDFDSGVDGIWPLDQDTSPAYGMEKGSNLQFVFKMNTVTATAFAPVLMQSYIEIITHSSITATPLAGNWEFANRGSNCNLRSQTGADINTPTVRIGNCIAQAINIGLFGSEYTRFRMSPQDAGFWSGVAANHFSYIWKGVKVSRQNSLLFDDTDAAVMDAYINLYDDTFSKDISIDYVLGLKFSYLDNMIVANFTQFTDTKIDYINYLRTTTAGDDLDGRSIPTLLRIGGTLNNIDTFNSNRVVLFYTDFVPLFKDLDDPYEIACSTSSAATVKCYHHQGEASVLCDTGTSR